MRSFPRTTKLPAPGLTLLSALRGDGGLRERCWLAQVIENKEWRTLYGGFVGADLSLGNTGYFLYGSVDYMWANNLSYDLGTVTTIFNPGGFTAGLSAGVQF